MESPPVELAIASSKDHFAAGRRLIRAYAAALEVDLGFQDFDREIDDLEACYGAPHGRLILARSPADRWIGCVALRRFATACCEMKRLYVEPEQRGGGIGDLLVAGIIRQARTLGYRSMLLDTLPGMEAAQALYRRFGFRERDAYRPNPIAGARFMELRLD